MQAASWHRSVLAMLTSAVVVAAGLLIGGVSPAAAAENGPAPIEQRNSNSVTADPLPTVQIDSGIVWTQEVVGNTVFAGGSFSNARPAGAAPGTNLIPRSNILAYNLTTGVITSFAPVINGQVKVIKASADGSRIYVGGSFNNVNGQTRWNFAAFDVATGALSTTFKPAVGGSYVNAIAVTNSAVYLGGLIQAGAGVARKNLVAFSTSGAGALLGWAPTTDLQVDSMVLTPSNDKLIVAGRFGTVNNVSQRGLAALDLSSGAILPWTAPSIVQNGVAVGTSGAGKAGIWELEADANAIYGTGWVYANKVIGNLEGLFSAEPGNGAIRWIADCHGDHYGVYSDGTNVYSTGHEHSCETANGMPQGSPSPGNMRNATVMTAAPKGTLLRTFNVNSIYADWSGYPAPAFVNWYPDWITGGVDGGQAGWTATGAGDYLLIGGEQAFVNGQRSQGITRFSRNPSTGKNSGPRLSDANWVPAVSSTTSGKVRVSIPANWDRDDLNLTYQLIRNGGGQPVATTTVQATYWSRPQVVLTDTVPAGSTPNYRIVAVDGDGNSENSATVSTTVTNVAGSDYAETVMDDGASLYWRLGGTAAQGANDLVGNNDATVRSGVTSNSGGALPSEPGPSYNFSGTTSGFLNSTSPASVGQQYSTELWFKTTTTTGGKLIGYGNSATGTSSSYDRHVYMRNDGRVTFGAHPGIVRTVTSTNAYRDGNWHHMVASQGWDGMKLYLDGQLVGSLPDNTAQAYNGYWRVGGDNLGSWPSRPSSDYFAGQIDEAAVYNRVLTSQEVSEHFAKGSGVAAPTAAFTFTTDELDASVNGSTSSAPPGRTITSYSWNWGDGTAAGSGVTATHPYATGGTYTITLTVTDSLGLTASTSKDVTVAPPHANPTAAFGTQVNGLSVGFDGTTSTAADGATIASYAWDFDDGDTSTQPAPTHLYDAAGTYDVTLTVVDSLGASDSVTQPVTVAAATTLAADEFQRTSASGWGTADVGGTWSTVSGSSVNGSVGLLSLMNSQTRATTLSGNLPSGTDARISVSIDKVANGGGAHVNIATRKTTAGEYRAKLRFSATGVVNVSVARLVGTTETLVANRVLTGYTHTAGATLDVRVRTVSTGPSTTVQVKVWSQGQPEPVDWYVTATDSDPGLQGTGQFAITTYVTGTATNGPIGIGFDHLSVVVPN